MFTLGCPDLQVTVDHQSLIPILGNRSLADIPNPRLYRFKEKFLRFRFKVQYLPGKLIEAPDCMSRVYDENEGEDNELNVYDELGAIISACYIASIMECCVSTVGKCSEDEQAITIPEVVWEGEKDKQYTALMNSIREGFPEKMEECSMLIQPFHKCRCNISVVC